MSYVIAENQSSFIPGRSTVDNILVLQETIHSFKNVKGRKGFMILKLDLEKAYDWLEWSFVKNSVHCLGLPIEIQHVISHCISSASMEINWNGNVTDPFNSSRGLRQGDPISPYLFVICLERLGHLIKDAVHNGNWIPFSFGRGSSTKISHMCFADNLILVTEASLGQVECIMNILRIFWDCAGQKINLDKSQVFFSQNVSNDQAEILSHYLGALMIHQRLSKNYFSFLLDKMRKKLNGWKAKSLSFAGRVTLAQSSLLSIPGYVFQTSQIPVSVCLEAKKICRDFIWGSTADARRCHLIS